MYNIEEPIKINLDKEYWYKAACAAISAELEARV